MLNLNDSLFFLVRDDSFPFELSAKPSAEDYSKFQKGMLEMRVFYVGSGEAILVCRDSTAFLVDCGEGKGESNKKLGDKMHRFLSDNGIMLEAIVASHPHEDHLNALPPLLETLKQDGVPKIPLYFNGTQKWSIMKKILGTKHVEAISVRPKKKLKFLQKAANGTFLVGRDKSEPKLEAAFLFLRYHGSNFLFTGDASESYEKRMISRLKPIHPVAHVLKVNHHGSEHATTQIFVDKMKPRISVSSSDSPSHHKLEAVVRQRLLGTGVVFTTYEEQEAHPKRDVMVRTDGKSWNLEGSKGILFEVATEAPVLKI